MFNIEQATSKDVNANLDQQGSAVRITGLTSDQSLKEILSSDDCSSGQVLTLHLKTLRFFRSRAGTLYNQNHKDAYECEHSPHFRFRLCNVP